MIRLTPELQDWLAAEYVLGTQTHRVRQRTRRLMASEPALAERVAWWEEQLSALGEAARPVPVPPWTWSRIKRELGLDVEPGTVDQSGWWSNVLVWRWSTALAATLALMMVLLPPPAPTPMDELMRGGVVMVLNDDQSRSAWLLSRRAEGEPLTARPLELPVLTAQQAFELWLLPPDAAPISVGLLEDEADTQLELDERLDALLKPGLGMAVSLEPPGGSPTGAPTGPVLFTGSIKSL